MRKILAVALVVLFAGCDTPPEAKQQIMSKHAEFYVFTQRMHDPDPANRPTPAQMQMMIETATKDVESLDRIVNGWKPDDAMKSVDFKGTVSKEILEKYEKKNTKSEREY